MLSDSARSRLAHRLVDVLGGRYSTEMGIDVDRGAAEVERWFLAATLFGNRIGAPIAERAYRALAEAGVETVADVRGRTWEELVRILDAAGYVRYDFRTASRLQALAEAVAASCGGQIGAVGQGVASPAALESALDELPGWGPTTVRIFLRELRGVWPAARPPLDARTIDAARHLGLLGMAASSGNAVRVIEGIAVDAGMDVRDLESALVRLSLTHGRQFAECPSGEECRALALPTAGRAGAQETLHAPP